MPIATPLDEVRLHFGDTDAAHPLLNDDEVNYFIAKRAGNVVAAAADCAQAAAAKFATSYDFEWQGGVNARGKYSRSQLFDHFTKLAQRLRGQVNGGLTVVQTTKVDGYSDDLSNRDGAGQASRTGRVRAGYTDPDLPA